MTQQTQQTAGSNTLGRIPGVPVGWELEAIRKFKRGDYFLSTGGRVAKAESDLTVCVWPILRKAHPYTTLNLSDIPIPEGYEYLGGSLESAVGRAGKDEMYLCVSGEICTRYSSLPTGGTYIRLVRAAPKLNVYGVEDKDIRSVEIPAGYEFADYRLPCTGEEYFYGAAGDILTAMGDHRSYDSPRIIVRKSAPKTKKVLVGEWEICSKKENRSRGSNGGYTCGADLAEGLLNGDKHELIVNRSNLRIEDRPL